MTGTWKYVLALTAALVVAVVAIELTRRDGPDGPAPQAKPTRIVSQTLSTDEVLLAICPRGRIAALSVYADDPAYSNVVETAKAVRGRAGRDAESILRLRPDLILTASYSRAELVEQLKSAGAPVVTFSKFDSFDHIRENIRTVGTAVGESAAAEKLIETMDARLAEIRDSLPEGRKPRVLSLDGGLYTAGSDTTFDDIANAAGAVNAAAANGVRGFPRLSTEKVLEWLPDFIITGAARGGEEDAVRALKADPAVAASAAARAGRIVVIDNRHLQCISHHVVRAVDDLAGAIHADQ